MVNLLNSNHTWYELWGPIPLIIVVILAYFYWAKIIRSSLYHVSGSQVSYFYTAISLFYIVKGSPVAVVAKDYLFSAHVLQVAVTLFFVVPLIILSFPQEFYRTVFWNFRMRFMMRVFAHPWLTAFSFNGLVTAYFIPSIFNVLQTNYLFLNIAQVILIIHAFFMWWVIITPLPELGKVQNETKLAYIFFTSVILLPISFFLVVILNVHYPYYASVAGDFAPVLTIIYDQQLGGGILKILQLATYSYAMLQIILQWGRDEEEMEGKVDDESIRVVQGVVIHLDDKR